MYWYRYVLLRAAMHYQHQLLLISSKTSVNPNQQYFYLNKSTTTNGIKASFLCTFVGHVGASPGPVPPGPAGRGHRLHAVRVRLRPTQPLLGLAGWPDCAPPPPPPWLAAARRGIQHCGAVAVSRSPAGLRAHRDGGDDWGRGAGGPAGRRLLWGAQVRTHYSSVSEPVEQKLFEIWSRSRNYRFDKYLLQSGWRMLGWRKTNFYLPTSFGMVLVLYNSSN